MDNIRNNEQNKRQDNRAFRDNFKNIQAFEKDSSFGGSEGGRKQEQEQKNRELRDNFKNIPKFMKDKGKE